MDVITYPWPNPDTGLETFVSERGNGNHCNKKESSIYKPLLFWPNPWPNPDTGLENFVSKRGNDNHSYKRRVQYISQYYFEDYTLLVKGVPFGNLMIIT